MKEYAVMIINTVNKKHELLEGVYHTKEEAAIVCAHYNGIAARVNVNVCYKVVAFEVLEA